MPSLRRLACLLLLLALPVAAKPAAPPTVTVFAAASLKESLDRVAADWSRRSGQKVLVSFAASSALAHQIEQGAPADLFISADNEWMDYLQARRQVDPRTRFDLVGNRLVLIVPATSRLRSIDLSGPGPLLAALGQGRLAVAETSSVPAGRYARQSLTRLGWWDAVSTRLAQAENVRAAMAFVALGEAPLGIVYATDAQAEPKVRVVARLPDASHDPIVYPVARVAASDKARTAGLLRFLRSEPAGAIFRKSGFTRP
jgi:molybdate transport system substrate-binding protein